jgi:hypothetical protein
MPSARSELTEDIFSAVSIEQWTVDIDGKVDCYFTQMIHISTIRVELHHLDSTLISYKDNITSCPFPSSWPTWKRTGPPAKSEN